MAAAAPAATWACTTSVEAAVANGLVTQAMPSRVEKPLSIGTTWAAVEASTAEPDAGFQITVAVSEFADSAALPLTCDSRSVAVLDSVSGSENESLSAPFFTVPRKPITTAMRTNARIAHPGLRTAQRDNPPMIPVLCFTSAAAPCSTSARSLVRSGAGYLCYTDNRE